MIELSRGPKVMRGHGSISQPAQSRDVFYPSSVNKWTLRQSLLEWGLDFFLRCDMCDIKR